MARRLITIQIATEEMLRWDDVKPTLHEVDNPGEVAQAIATATGMPVRMTYYNDATSLNVCRNNGHYFYPELKQTFKTFTIINQSK